jgi:C-terminal processing protease CtpA/Prc
MMKPCFDRRSRGLALAAFLAPLILAAASLQAQDKVELKLDKANQRLDAQYQEILNQYRPVKHNYTNEQLTEPINVHELAIEVRDPQQELLGATLAPLSDALRAQLNVAAGQGLVVASLRNDGPSAQAGLKLHDVLLTLADKFLASADDLSKQLKAAGESPVTLKLLRAGKPIEIQVRPIYRVTLGPVSEEKKKYFLGISLSGLDEDLRSQLGVPVGQGVIITDVNKKSPAEAAGLKVHDVVLELGGKVIDTPEKLATLVQAGQDKPQAIKLLRAGNPLSINVTAETRIAENIAGVYAGDMRIRILNLADAEQEVAKERALTTRFKRESEVESLKKIDDLQRQVRSLREALDQFKASQSPKK